MPDREKVIAALHCRAYDDDFPCWKCAYYKQDEKPVARCDYRGLMDDAIELLKEKGAQKFLVDENGKITPLPIVIPNCPLKEQEKIVRCKDCKYGKIHGIDVECVAHEEVGYDPEPWHPLDWFCADGERRGNE